MKAPEEKRIDFFASIPKFKIRTGCDQGRWTNFWNISGKVQTPSEALKYPLITVALALTEPDQTLTQLSTKATLRRLQMKQTC